ncbi:MAG: ferritin-like domain-containing protein [Alphaproteobacteria bacterium]|nr:ferritin-like domain-containing protein [Alphaproteobacteria bacterium]
MRDHWTLDTIAWDKFDRSKLNPEMVRLVKAASLVEYNAKDYVDYLRNVFKGEPEMMAHLERWGVEEVQHGAALGRWAEMADPTFKFDKAFERFRKVYRPEHFIHADGSVRGSRVGELIARCVVECGTSSSYTALRDASEEPVLKQIAGLIAADEFAHYRLFYRLMDVQPEKKPGFWRRLYIAATRISESTDDELASAYYSANFPEGAPYDRNACNAAYQSAMMLLYKRPHIDSAIGMVGKAIGMHPESRVLRWASGALFGFISWRWAKPATA